MGWMMAGMLTQLPLPLLPAGAAEIAPGVGLVTGEDGGGLVSVHGLATFAWDAGDEAGRRLAAVQLVRLRAVSQAQAAAAFGVDPVTVWRWDQALAAGGVAGLVPARRGPKGASKLTAGAGGADRRAGRGGGDPGRDRRGDRGVDVQRAQRAGPGAAARAARGGRCRRGAAPAWSRGRMTSARARRFRCCRTRFPVMGSGCWPGGGCWARAPSRCSRRVPGIRWPGCCWRCPRWRAPGCWMPPERCTAGSGTGFTGWARRC